MVHGELIKTGQIQKLSYRQLKTLERIDAKKARETKYLDLAGRAIDGGSQVLGRALEGTITGPVVLALLLTAAYGWQPTRTLFEQLAQGVAYGASQGWKNSIAPTLSHIPGISPFVGPDSKQNNPKPPPPSQPPVCIEQWTFLKWSPLFGWNRAWFNDVGHAISDWETFNALDLVGNLVDVTTCTDSAGAVTHTYSVTKYAPGHSDIDNPANQFFNIQ
jgi:hypothetical protein